MQRIVTDDTTRPVGKSAPKDLGAAARSPGEAIWRPRARSPGAKTPAFARPEPPNRLSGRSRHQSFMSSRPNRFLRELRSIHPFCHLPATIQI